MPKEMIEAISGSFTCRAERSTTVSGVITPVSRKVGALMRK